MAQSSLSPNPTYRLEAFGKLALTGGATGSLSHQRRRLALLALLAAAGERGLSRDQIIGYLWSEGTGESGRHSLEQLLHALRRALGQSLFSGTNPLSLNSEAMASDVSEFNLASASGAFADAVALYNGPFMEGFYLEEAPEFERWATSERARLASKYADGLTQLASAAEAGGDHASAVRWRRKLVVTDPVSSRHALALMQTFVAAGDRTAALQHARVYELLVRQELESEPDPSVTSYAASLRTSPAAPSMPPAAPLAEIIQVQPVIPAPTPIESRVIEVPEHATGARGGRKYWWTAGLAAAGLLLIAAYFGREKKPVAATAVNRIVVIPFRVTAADSSLEYLGEGAADLIAPMLNGEGGPVAVDSRSAISTWNRITLGRAGNADDARKVALELGAELVLSGTIVEANGRLTIAGTVLSAKAPISRTLTSVSGSADSAESVLNSFVRQLLVREAGVSESSIAEVTSRSLPAVRAYLDGRGAYRRADEASAIDNFARALDIDSTFALAAVDLAVATGKLLRTEMCRNETCRIFSVVPGFLSAERDQDLFDRAIRLGWNNRTRLGPRDRPVLDALRGPNYPREASARQTLAQLARAIRASPDRPELRYLLGTLLLYQGPALGFVNSSTDAAAAFRAASRLDSSYLAPLGRMVDVAALSGDTAELRRAAHFYLSRDSSGSTADYVRWIVGAAGRSQPANRRVRFKSLSAITLDHIYLISQMTGYGIDDADSVGAIITENASEPIERSVAFRRAHFLSLNRGRPSDATRFLHRMDEVKLSGPRFRQFSMASAMFDGGDQRVADSSGRELAKALAHDTLGPMSHDAERLTSAAMAVESLWYLEHGDTAAAKAAARWLRRHAEGQSRNRVFLMLPDMLIGSRAREPEAKALRAFVDSVSLEGCCELPEFVNLILARAYEASGDEASALRVIRRGASYHPPRLLSTYLREEGRLASRAGDRGAAIRAYERYLILRSDPEPSRAHEREMIRAEVTRLKAMH